MGAKIPTPAPNRDPKTGKIIRRSPNPPPAPPPKRPPTGGSSVTPPPPKKVQWDCPHCGEMWSKLERELEKAKATLSDTSTMLDKSERCRNNLRLALIVAGVSENVVGKIEDGE